MSNTLRPHGLYSPWNSLGQNTGVGSHALLQGIFPTQESNRGLHCRRILYQLSYQGSPQLIKPRNICWLSNSHGMSSVCYKTSVRHNPDLRLLTAEEKRHTCSIKQFTVAFWMCSHLRLVTSRFLSSIWPSWLWSSNPFFFFLSKANCCSSDFDKITAPTCYWASLVAQLVKNPLAMWET